MIPPRGDHPIHGHFWVPIDDENCWAWSYDFHPVRALKPDRSRCHEGRRRRTLQIYSGTYRPLANKTRLSDRSRGAEGRQDFSGVAGFAIQDASLQESMARSATAPRRTWSPPTTASSWRAIA